VSFLDEALLRSLTATLIKAFGEVRLYRPDPNTLVFLASDRPLNVEVNLAASGRPLLSSPRHYGLLGIHTAEDLFAALAADADGTRALATGAPLITDDFNRMATSSVYDFGRGLTAAEMGRILAPYDPLQNPDSWVFRGYRGRLSFAYIERRISMFAAIDASTRDRITALSRALAGGQALPEGDRTVMARAVELAADNEWKAVSELDADLARVAWTDSWKLESVQMRADWRSRVISPALRRRAGDECISIIDEAIVVQPSLALYGLRARCGLSAARYDVVVESLWNLGNATWHNARRLPAEQRLTAKRDLETVITALQKNLPEEDNRAVQRSFDIARRDEVVRKLRDRITGLE
jgi:hypothetical protein